jgi:Holliday junction resolvase RusA-like endonuclease
LPEPYLTLRLDGRPQAWKRATGTEHRWTPAEVRAEKAAWQSLAVITLRGRSPLVGPVVVVARFVMPTRGRVDVDNLLKLPLDALNGVVWADDSQVVLAQIEKLYAPDLDAPVAHSFLRVWPARLDGDRWVPA